MNVIAALALAAAVGAPAATETAVWDFSKGPAGWQPRAASVAVEQVKGGAVPESRGSLRIRGSLAEGWNYATSDQRPMQAGRLYRLSAWVRVDRLGAGTPAPYLKCEFVPADPGRDLGRASTTAYDTAAMGKWQRLDAEFRAPEGTARCWLALEKGTDGPAEIDALLDQVTIEPIAQLTALERYRLDPLPAPLVARKGVHPRLFLDAARVAALRREVGTTHAGIWEKIRAQADRCAASGPPAYRLRDSSSGDEQLWQRSVGNAMPPLALAYLVTGERNYLDGARAWALASCSYPTWGLGSINGMDLAAGHQLLGLAIVYDWCYADLGDEARRTIRDTLVRRAGAMFEAAASGKAWWSRSYLQNHLWVDITGMMAAGLALYDEVPDAILWAGLPLDKLRTTTRTLGPDGASHEGVGYWQYGAEYLLKLMALSQELLGVELHDTPWWRNTAAYAQYLTIPRAAWTRQSSLVDIADCPRSNWYGPDYLLRRLAHLYHDPHAQWLAAQVDEAGIASAEAGWLNLLWYDPAVAARPPADLPTLRHFDDIGIVSARTGWSGDESLVVFKCGPFLGHEALRTLTYDAGGGHVHPDANHFVLFGDGEWLIRDDGYQAKDTGTHNTLLVDGKGQLGEGHQWFAGSECLRAKADPRILLATSTPAVDHIAGDAAPAYPASAGLRRYVRHLLFLKPDVLIVADDISLAKEAPLELRFHPEHPAAQEAGAFISRSPKAVLRLEPLTPEGVTLSAGDVPNRAAQASDSHRSPSLFTIRLQRAAGTWRNAVALSWAPASAEPPRVTLRQEGNVWRFTAGGRSVRLDWNVGAEGR